MNWAHLKAFLWLRWRLGVNQWRRAGAFNAALMMILVIGMMALAFPLFIGCFFIGLYAFERAEPPHLMYVWDGIVVAFLFFWMIGLITELQRTESLSLSKFLHLPVSVNGAFLINYVSSLLRVSLIVFAPAMFGLSLGLIAARGPMLILVLPALAAFFLMITALTYQLQGWLASLMGNPRRRRTVGVMITAVFILVMQAPNLINLMRPWEKHQPVAVDKTWVEQETARINGEAASGKITTAEQIRQMQELGQKQLQEHQRQQQQAQRAMVAQWEDMARMINMIVPLGWLPLGVGASAAGHLLPAFLGIAGMTAIGTISLWRAYLTTIRLYQGTFTTGKKRAAPGRARTPEERKPGVLLVERRLPGVSEPVSAIALGGLRSLLRSPEAKMMLLTVVILTVIFGSIAAKARGHLPEGARPFLAIGGMFAVLFGIVGLTANQFGFDRDGFRVFVLSAASRRDILLGKNLAFAPLTLGPAVIILTIVQVAFPLRVEHFLAMFPQFLSMYLMFCLVMNLLSIYAPMHIAPGSLKPTNPKLLPILLQMLIMMCFFPLTQAPMLLPLGIEALLEWRGWSAGLPVALVLTFVELAVAGALYRWVLQWEGRLLQAREQKILESVTKQ